MWDLSCPDWPDRMRSGRSLIPPLPLIEGEADIALAIFDELRLPDVPGTPKMAEACGQWFRDLVRVVFGSWDPVAKERYIRDFFAMLPKGQSKTTYSAGLMIVALLMNKRPKAEALFVAPTQAIADNAFEKAVGMINLSDDLKRRFKPREHLKIIEDLQNGTKLRVKTFDVNILTGAILIFALVDELHLLGKNAHTAKVLRQIRGGLEKTPEGALLITTTQSDEQPAGAFKDELKLARKIRDGKMRGLVIRPLLPVLYEFPDDMAADREQWEDPANWGLVMPNLGRSVHLNSLIGDWNSEKDKGEHAVKIWASQHLNVEIGVGINDDGWIGAQYWDQAGDTDLTLDRLIELSDVAVIGFDGGGMDDLIGINVTGRTPRDKRGKRKWLSWNHAIANPKVLEVRKGIEAQLRDFEAEGSLTFAEVGEDMQLFGDIVQKVYEAGLLPKEKAIGFDQNNIASLIDEITGRGIPVELLWRVKQGSFMSPAINELPRKLSEGSYIHSGTGLMSWAVGNCKIESKINGVMATKQAAGRAKIDPAIAMFNAAILMSWDPQAVDERSVYEDQGLEFIG